MTPGLGGFAGRIFEFVHAPDAETPVITSANLPRVNRVLLESLSDQVHIAEKACYAISQLAVCYKNRDTSPMSTYCQETIQALLNTVSSPPMSPEQRVESSWDSLSDLGFGTIYTSGFLQWSLSSRWRGVSMSV